MNANFSDLRGLTLAEIKGMEVGSVSIEFTSSNGRRFLLYHLQDCCESVEIESVVGDVRDLIGYEILFAEESCSDKNPEGISIEDQESFTWTFYKLATIKGYVDIRWYGESNGYYSEAVFLEELKS